MKKGYINGKEVPSFESMEEYMAYKNTKNVSILGTIYTIKEQTEAENELLKDKDGYCDVTSKEIVIVDLSKVECEIKNPEWYRRKLLRHEIIHAFLSESGLDECTNWEDTTKHNEQMVDWFAIQFPKMMDAFIEAGCLDIPTEEITMYFNSGDIVRSVKGDLQYGTV